MRLGLRRTSINLGGAIAFLLVWVVIVTRECDRWPGSMDVSALACMTARGEALPLLIVISPALTIVLACVFFAGTWALHRILPKRAGRDA